MTPLEIASMRDKVARARHARAEKSEPARRPQYGTWTVEREAAGASALAALKEATRRSRGLCVYCGRNGNKPRRGPSTCLEHRDLPGLDPVYEGGLS